MTKLWKSVENIFKELLYGKDLIKKKSLNMIDLVLYLLIPSSSRLQINIYQKINQFRKFNQVIEIDILRKNYLKFTYRHHFLQRLPLIHL